jgi:hypothetical protein
MMKSILEFGLFRRTALSWAEDRVCWGFRKYLGSMLVFDFGEKIEVKSRSGVVVLKGIFSIGVRDCYWEFKFGSRGIGESITSDSINTEAERDICHRVSGVRLIDLIRASDALCAVFSSGDLLLIDMTNKYSSDDPVIEFSTNGEFLYMMPDNKFFHELA